MNNSDTGLPLSSPTAMIEALEQQLTETTRQAIYWHSQVLDLKVQLDDAKSKLDLLAASVVAEGGALLGGEAAALLGGGES